MSTIRMTRWISIAALAVLALMFSAPASAQVSIGVAITTAPPDLPVYEQPLCPGEDYIWVPGYWAWGDYGYYWVPGTWVLAPQPGFFWTPGYWAWGGSAFVWNVGYWGPVVGFYGGVNYGFGYFGNGYGGGRWQGGHFFYNTQVNNVNVTVIHNTYNTTVVNNNVTVNRVSYNGGNGGLTARPTAEEEAAAHERHIAPVAAQTRNEEAARSNPEFRASVNHGAPAVAATAKPGQFKGSGVVAAREAGEVHGDNARPEENRPEENKPSSRPPSHANELPPLERPTAPNTGNAKLDQKYQQQQQKLQAQQEKERQKLDQQQNKEHQQAEQQHANAARTQQMEQRHAQQTQQLQQRQAQQSQRLQQHQQPHPSGKPEKP